MSDNKNEIIKRETLEKAMVRPPSNSNLLNIATNDLSTEERVALRTKVINEKLALDVSQQSKASHRVLH